MLAIFALHGLIRVATLAVRWDSPTFRGVRQVATGIANDLFVSLAFAAIALMCALAPRLSSRAWAQRLGRVGSGLLWLLFTLIMLLVTANFISVLLSGSNISYYDLSDLSLRAMPALLSALVDYCRSEGGWKIALAAVSLMLGSWWAFSASVHSMRAVIPRLTRRRLFGTLAALLVVCAGFRSFALSWGYVLYEPVETHPLPFLAWRYDKDTYYALEQPTAGLDKLTQYFQAIKAQPLGREERPLLTRRNFRAELPAEAQAPQLPPGTNVVFIMLESFGAAEVAAKPEITPELNRMLAGGWQLDRHYTTVFRTVGAQFSLLCSQQNPPRFFVSREFPQTALHCLPSVLRDAGYSTYSVAGTSHIDDNEREWLSHNGIAHAIASEDFAATAPRVGENVQDGPLLERALAELDAATKPAFMYVLTTSTHHPYTLPPDFVAAHPEIAGWTEAQRAFFYTDTQLGQFFRAARTRPWFDQTLFVLVGDHPPWTYGDGAPGDSDFIRTRKRYQTIAGFIHPALPPRKLSQDTTHTAIAPTILGLLGIEAETELAGVSIFTPEPFGAIGSQENGRASYYLLHNGEKVVFRDTLSGNCTMVTAASPDARVPCDAPAAAVSDEFKQQFYDTVQWQILKLQSRGPTARHAQERG